MGGCDRERERFKMRERRKRERETKKRENIWWEKDVELVWEL